MKFAQNVIALVIGCTIAAVLVMMLGAFGVTFESVTAAFGK